MAWSPVHTTECSVRGAIGAEAIPPHAPGYTSPCPDVHELALGPGPTGSDDREPHHGKAVASSDTARTSPSDGRTARPIAKKAPANLSRRGERGIRRNPP